MRRLVMLVVLTTAHGSLAHQFELEFLLSKPVGNYPDDTGLVGLQWVDFEAPGGKASATLYATRQAAGPFTPLDIDAGAQVSDEFYLSSPIDVFEWDTAGLEEGCWQVHALLTDPIDQAEAVAAPGRFTVRRGANVPPAIWVTTEPAALPDRDGMLELQWAVDEPDDLSVATVTWHPAGGSSTTMCRVDQTAGMRSAGCRLDANVLPPQPGWLRVEVASANGATCDAWWSGFLFGRSGSMGPQPVPDAGQPASAPDAGEPDAGTTSIAIPPTRSAIGCVAAHVEFPFLVLALLWLLRRRRQ